MNDTTPEDDLLHQSDSYALFGFMGVLVHARTNIQQVIIDAAAVQKALCII